MKNETNLEFIPNSPCMTGKIFWVDKSGNDCNDGSREHPFATLNRAASELVPGSVVVVGSGVYREEIMLPCNGHRFQPEKSLLFLGQYGEKVWIKGSDLFTPEWEPAGPDVWNALLPEKLFIPGSYNPYCLSLDPDTAEKVRPCSDTPVLQRTRGGIFFDGKAFRQTGSRSELLAKEESFLIDADGRRILVHTPAGKTPSDFLVELVIRKRCFSPCFSGTLFYETRNIDASQAAEPGALCGSLPERIRTNPQSGITVERTRCFRSGFLSPALSVAPDGDFLLYVADASKKIPGICVGDQVVFDFTLLRSSDAGITWTEKENGSVGHRLFPTLFSDLERGFIVRSYLEYRDPSILFTMPGNHCYFEEYSFDNGLNWSEPVPVIDSGYYFDIVKLSDGSYIRPGQMSRIGLPYDDKAVFLLGSWNGKRIVWHPGAEIVVPPEESDCGIAEPHLCQFADGRLFSVLRQGARLASHNSPGIPSGKLCSSSNDGGRSWSKPEPLLYENGELVYSPRCFQNLFTSRKNGRSYLITNIAAEPCFNCDPRNRLQIIEIDPVTCRLKRNTESIIEAKLPEHHDLVRFSNFLMTEDPVSGNLILFLKMELSEFCPLRYGLDFSIYRYEIILPTA